MAVNRWLITGERDWRCLDDVAEEIGRLEELYGADRLVIVHGDCPTGADSMAQLVCEDGGIKFERFPVRHSLDGPWPAAGPRRNGRMVSSGYFSGGTAFWSGKRKGSGTLDCMAQATELGIPMGIVPRKQQRRP